MFNIDAEILKKIIANQIQKPIMSIIHQRQVEFIPRIQG